ncbi:MAG: hypothetical protein LBH12_06045 [Dysgonamonadaceae bacterium]|jgi:hypothetical protein|nr:hypothetical protein [Dysgonamonadaceae bacterium]
MKKSMNQLDKIVKDNPFLVPEGYFEGLTDKITAQLPPKIQFEPQKRSLWDQVKPWVYMAAMFAGIALMVKLFVNSPVDTQSTFSLASDAEIEEFYQYYEEQLTKNVYHEALYLGELYNYDDAE